MDPDSKPIQNLREANDNSLVERTRCGDLSAFEELVRRYHAPLISFLRFYSSGSTDVEDVAQEAFMKCFTHLDQFDTDRKFKNWLYTIARRTIPRLQTTTGSTPESLDGVIDKGANPHMLAEQAEQNDSIWAVVRDATSDDEFQLMWFRYAEQLSMKDVAMVMQRSENALKMQLSRLRNRLRPHLQPFAETENVDDLFDAKKKAA